MFTAAEICLVQTQTTLHHLNAQAARRVGRSRLASYAKVQCGQNWNPRARVQRLVAAVATGELRRIWSTSIRPLPITVHPNFRKLP